MHSCNFSARFVCKEMSLALGKGVFSLVIQELKS